MIIKSPPSARLSNSFSSLSHPLLCWLCASEPNVRWINQWKNKNRIFLFKKKGKEKKEQTEKKKVELYYEKLIKTFEANCFRQTTTRTTTLHVPFLRPAGLVPGKKVPTVGGWRKEKSCVCFVVRSSIKNRGERNEGPFCLQQAKEPPIPDTL